MGPELLETAILIDIGASQNPETGLELAEASAWKLKSQTVFDKRRLIGLQRPRQEHKKTTS